MPTQPRNDMAPSPGAAAQHRERLVFLDSLRGIAAVLVVFSHTLHIPQPNPPLPDSFLARAIAFGGTGVWLFFVISGFSLAMTMRIHRSTGSYLTSYYISRFFRIAPLYYFILILSLCRDYFVWDLFSLKKLLTSLTFIFNVVPGHQQGIVWASWTISAEMIFYVLFPFIVALSIRSQIWIVAASALIYLVWSFVNPTFYSVFFIVGFIPIFVLGMFAYDFYVKFQDRGRDLTFVGGIYLVFLVTYIYGVQVADTNPFVRYVTGLGYAALLVASGFLPLTLIVNRVTAFYGKISYSVYLCHPMIIYFGFDYFSIPYRYFGDTLVSFLLTASLALAVVTAAAFLTYTVIERPFIKAGRALFDIVRSRQPGATVAPSRAA